MEARVARAARLFIPHSTNHMTFFFLDVIVVLTP